uniref:Uncharacterized protein n=1 Tax=Opuntia streptacantha TaxID=393608 RepID=A0A7C9EGZ6_OPUST
MGRCLFYLHKRQPQFMNIGRQAFQTMHSLLQSCIFNLQPCIFHAVIRPSLRISHRWEIFYATKPTLQRSPLQQVFKLPISPVNKNSSLTSVGKSIPLSALFCSFL